MLLDLLYSEDIDIKDLEKYFLASSQGQVPGFLPKNFITTLLSSTKIVIIIAGIVASDSTDANPILEFWLL